MVGINGTVYTVVKTLPTGSIGVAFLKNGNVRVRVEPKVDPYTLSFSHEWRAPTPSVNRFSRVTDLAGLSSVITEAIKNLSTYTKGVEQVVEQPQKAVVEEVPNALPVAAGALYSGSGKAYPIVFKNKVATIGIASYPNGSFAVRIESVNGLDGALDLGYDFDGTRYRKTGFDKDALFAEAVMLVS